MSRHHTVPLTQSQTFHLQRPQIASARYGECCRGGGEHPEPHSGPGERGEVSAGQPRPPSPLQLQAQVDHRAPDLPRSVSVRGGPEREVQSERLALRLTLRLPLLLSQDQEETTEGEREGGKEGKEGSDSDTSRGGNTFLCWRE